MKAAPIIYKNARFATVLVVGLLFCLLIMGITGLVYPASALAQDSARNGTYPTASLTAIVPADRGTQESDTDLPKYRPLKGTVYVSYAELLKGTTEMKTRNTFVTAVTGEESGMSLWHVPVDLAEVSAIDLDDYKLGDFKMPAANPNADYHYETTVLQLLVYMNQRWFGTDVSLSFCRDNLLEHAGVTQAFGKQLGPYSFQGTGQLDFLVDGKLVYPDLSMLAGNSNVFGGTPAVVPLQPDQSIDFVRLPYAAKGYNSETGAYTKSYSFRPGIREFVDNDDAPVYRESALEGVPKTLRIAGVSTVATDRFSYGELWPENGNVFIEEQFWDGDYTMVSGGYSPIFVESEYEKGCPIYWGRTYGDALGEVRTDAEGVLSIVFPEPGTYYVWSDAIRTFNGGYSANSTDVFYKRTGFNDASPVLCKVEVGANPVAPILPEAIEPAYLGETFNCALDLGGWPVPSVSVVAGNIPPGLSLDASGTFTGIPEQQGLFTFTLRAENGVDPADNHVYTMEVLGRPPTVSSGLNSDHLPACDVGFSYFWPLSVTGSPWPEVTANGLPRGLRYDASLQAIVGVPEEAGSFTVELIAANGVGNDGRPDTTHYARAQFELTVDSRLVRIYSEDLPDIVVDQDYFALIDGAAVNGDALSWNLAEDSALPEGLSLSQDGLISGTVHNAGTYTFAVVARDAHNNTSSPATLTVRCKSKYRVCTGTVYLTITYRGKHVVSNGAEANEPLRYVPVDMAQVSAIDLDKWTDASGESLGRYNMEAQDPDADYVYECTLLQLFVYASELYSSGGGNSLDITGPFGSTWLAGGGILDLGGQHNGNLFYYVNGRYPLEYEGWGSVSNTTVINPGDFVDVCTWESGGVGDSSTFGGFYYFMEGDEPTTGEFSHGTGEPVHAYATTVSAGLDVRVASPSTDVRQHTVFKEIADKRVYWGKRYGHSLGSVVTGADGTAHIDFPDERCLYYLWTAETKFTPAYATVEVRLDDDDPSVPVYPAPDVEGYVQDFACGTVGQPFATQLDLGDTWAGSLVELYPTSLLPKGLELLPDGTIQGVPMESGVFEIHGQMKSTKDRGEFLVRFLIWDAAPVFENTDLAKATEGVAYTASLQASSSCIAADITGVATANQVIVERGSAAEGDDATWLIWDADTGALSGTPPAGAKTYTLVVRARVNADAVADAWLAGRYAYIDWLCDIGRISRLDRTIQRSTAKAEALQVAEQRLAGYDTGWVKIPIRVAAKASSTGRDVAAGSGSASAAGAKKNPAVVSAKLKTVKASKLKKKARMVTSAITVKKAPRGSIISFKRVKKGSSKALAKVNSKTGKITVKKGTKAGLYKVKVKVTVKHVGYQTLSKTVLVKIRVKR